MRKLFRLGNMLRLIGPVTLAALISVPLAVQEPVAAAADEPVAADKSKKPATAEESLPGERLPSMIYLPDEKGTLRPVPGFDLEELIELYKVKNRLEEQNRPPAYSITEIRFDGTADGTCADLSGEFTIAIHSAGWVRVPLRLADSMLAETAKYDGPGDHVIKVAPTRAATKCGYAASPTLGIASCCGCGRPWSKSARNRACA